MSKDLEAIYKDIIGGPPLVTGDEPSSQAGDGDTGVGDQAYKQPNYDGSGEETDPREAVVEDKPWEEGDPEPKDDPEDEPKDDPSTKKTEGKEDDFSPIADSLVEAGRALDLSDDEIVKLAEEQPRVLEIIAEKLAKASLPPVAKPDELRDDKAAAKDEALPDFDIDEDEADEQTLKVVKYLKSVVPSLTEKIKTLETQLQTQEQDLGGVKEVAQAEAVRRVDHFFNQNADILPTLGNTKSLTGSQKEARIACHGTAVWLQKGSDGKLSDDQALSMAVSMYRGQISDSTNKAKIVSDLSGRKRKFMARPSHGKKPLLDKQKEKGTEEERVLGVIEDKMNSM